MRPPVQASYQTASSGPAACRPVSRLERARRAAPGQPAVGIYAGLEDDGLAGEAAAHGVVERDRQHSAGAEGDGAAAGLRPGSAAGELVGARRRALGLRVVIGDRIAPRHRAHDAVARGDRKSTRLNSSHTVISYAVFCLKKKKKKKH